MSTLILFPFNPARRYALPRYRATLVPGYLSIAPAGATEFFLAIANQSTGTTLAFLNANKRSMMKAQRKKITKQNHQQTEIKYHDQAAASAIAPIPDLANRPGAEDHMEALIDEALEESFPS